MTVQDQSGGNRRPSAILTRRDELSLGASLRSLNTAIRLKEPISCGTDYSPKVRKPYTITKQREKWTEEEHKKFLEALKLYGRAWRRIEEHVGTKTTIQIRSHAQKFFSKVVRDSSTGSLELIEIPPPRPKRKPVHPYPRKLVDPLINTEASKKDQQRSPSPNSSVSEQEQQSPTSVLSAVVSGYSTPSHIEEIGFSSPPPVAIASIANEKLGLFSDLCQSSKDEAEEASACARHIKLFGTMLLVSDAEEPAPNIKNVEPPEMLTWLTLSSKNTRKHASLHHDKPDLDDVRDGEVHINGHLGEMKTRSGSKERELNQGRNARCENQGFLLGSRVILSHREECSKGFVPYKRLIASSEGATLCGEDNREKQRIRLCL